MNELDHLDDLLICRLDDHKKIVSPCTIVIFGASGDLTQRKLIPALYQLFKAGQLPPSFRIIGFARREKSSESFRGELGEAARQFSRCKDITAEQWQNFSANIDYCQGDLNDRAAYKKLSLMIQESPVADVRSNVLFYLAISPSQFLEAIAALHNVGLLNEADDGQCWRRVVIEKPFGHDKASAIDLSTQMAKFLRERQIFRIDHYLGKETVQNILIFRFANSIFEPLWSREQIEYVQLTVSEKLGVGTRGGYYEEAGALRDMVQNHLLQVLALVAMEPPISLEAESVRDSKAELLKSIRIIEPKQTPLFAVRGQYTSGEIDGAARPAYRSEPGVNPASNVETYAALKLWIDNWRWSGVPFYLRTGKNLPLTASEVRVQFRSPPKVLFAAQCGPTLEQNAITIRLQPNEGITLRFNGKIPGASTNLRQLRMHFSYDSEFGAYTPEAYERLLLDAMAGDATLFLRRDLVEMSWNVVDPIRSYWSERPVAEDEFYAAGTWGPQAAEALLSRLNHIWRQPTPPTT